MRALDYIEIIWREHSFNLLHEHYFQEIINSSISRNHFNIFIFNLVDLASSHILV